nr:sigma-70 family RNA polymerase sigma factor [Acidovorax sp. CCYZU-2555]
MYVSHHPWLLGWLRRKLHCPHNAADVAHDTFERILVALQRGTLENLAALREPRAFLTTTATRIVISQARRREVERACLEALAMVAPLECEVAAPDQLLQAVQTLVALAALLDGLSDKARQAFLLYRLEEMPQADIAALLGVSVSRVKQYVAQAMVHCYAVQHGMAAAR